jgi:hypothetical protein
MRAARRVVSACVLAAAVLASAAPRAAAQSTAAPAEFASSFLPPHHWAVDAARRLSLLGLTDRRFAWGDGSISRREVGYALQSAVANAAREKPALAAMAQGYWLRFVQEFPMTAAELERRTLPLSERDEGWAAVGYVAETGRMLPVRSVDNTRENVRGPFPLPNSSTAAVNTDLAVPLGSHLAVRLAPEREYGNWSLGDSYALASWKALGIWAGRRSFAYGPGAGGGIVFNGTTSFLGGGVSLMEPVRLPWIFRYIGPIRFETFLSRIDSSASIKHPFVIASHGSISPFPRLLIGFTQAFMFSGSGLPPFNWPNFVQMYHSHGINSAGSEFENGVASAEIRFRAPTPVIPTELYLEWGSEDNHSAWALFPATVVGIRAPMIPGAPALSLGVEHAFFHGPCANCNYYATWYRHYLFKDGWTVDRQLIGHPLGGEGEEWLAYGRWDNPTRALRFNAQTFLRDRGPFNLFSPAREGQSVGGALDVTYRATPMLDVMLNGSLEVGQTHWTASSVFGGFRWIF